MMICNVCKSICNVPQKVFAPFYFLLFRSIWVKMIEKIRVRRNLCPKLKSKMGLYRAVLTTHKTSIRKLILYVFEFVQTPKNEKIDPREANFCLKLKFYNCRKKVCANIRTDEDNLNNTKCPNWNTLYLNVIRGIKRTMDVFEVPIATQEYTALWRKQCNFFQLPSIAILNFDKIERTK